MVQKQLFALLIITVAFHSHATPLSDEVSVPAPPALEVVGNLEVGPETVKNPEDLPNPDQKWIVPLFAFNYAPAPTTTTPPPGPHPQVVIIPTNSTISVVAQQPLSLVQGPSPTVFTANAPGPNAISLQTGK
ncbi:unnamed protein product [Allacma fusca]|uniref:Uncharacterized protein n=1 Tax=Allacma fusca TaxID=39272 RepID=A0A8J2JQP2_9HEXA|nr:unnamed protein product [Allacma fusca]